MENQRNKKIVIFGKTGCGKSYLINHKLLKERITRHLVIWDYIGEYDVHGIIIDNYENFVRYAMECTEENKTMKVVLRLDVEFFPSVCEVVNSIGNILFIVEEIDTVTSANYLPKELGNILRFGRHYNVHLIVTSKRPAEVPRLLTSQSSEIYAFQTNEKIDLKYIEDYARISKEEIQNLKIYNDKHTDYIHKEI